MPSAISSSTTTNNDIQPETHKNEQEYDNESTLLARDFETLTNIFSE